MSEIKDMGVEFVEALCCIADVLKAADHGNYIGNSLAIDIAQHPECHLKTMYKLSQVDERINVSVFPTTTVLHTIFYPPRPWHCGISYFWRKYITTKGDSTRCRRILA